MEGNECNQSGEWGTCEPAQIATEMSRRERKQTIHMLYDMCTHIHTHSHTQVHMYEHECSHSHKRILKMIFSLGIYQ